MKSDVQSVELYSYPLSIPWSLVLL